MRKHLYLNIYLAWALWYIFDLFFVLGVNMQVDAQRRARHRNCPENLHGHLRQGCCFQYIRVVTSYCMDLFGEWIVQLRWKYTFYDIDMSMW